MRDFTLEMYSRMAGALVAAYRTAPFRETVSDTSEGLAALRHDVDRRAEAALPCARICADAGIRATFYFRYPYTFEPQVLRAVADMGHEVGYHYETLTKVRGDVGSAVALFREELAEFRRYVQVDTACMHGSPMSRWDNRDVWSATSLEDHGLIGEPYLSLTADTAYLTDTGRGWNHRSASVRDAMPGPMPQFRSTEKLVGALRRGELPRRLMINVHPERWNDRFVPWVVELVGQTAKNQVKSIIRRTRRPARAAAV